MITEDLKGFVVDYFDPGGGQHVIGTGNDSLRIRIA
jgi:hypothetical protein